MEEEISMLVKHGKPCYGERELSKPIEHVYDHRKYNCTNVESPVLKSDIKSRSQEHCRHYECHQKDLNSLEDINK
ncbi:hypothetical protein LguiA_028706 [Lonicera macranthoides]